MARRPSPPGSPAAADTPSLPNLEDAEYIDDDDDDSDVGIAYPRMRTAFRVMALSLVLAVIGILFILVPVVLTPDPMSNMRTFIVVGVVFIGLGLLVFVIDIIWCRCIEKSIDRKLNDVSNMMYKQTVFTVSDRQVTAPLHFHCCGGKTQDINPAL